MEPLNKLQIVHEHITLREVTTGTASPQTRLETRHAIQSTPQQAQNSDEKKQDAKQHINWMFLTNK